jgi:hypothetical protein
LENAVRNHSRVKPPQPASVSFLLKALTNTTTIGA